MLVAKYQSFRQCDFRQDIFIVFSTKYHLLLIWLSLALEKEPFEKLSKSSIVMFDTNPTSSLGYMLFELNYAERRALIVCMSY